MKTSSQIAADVLIKLAEDDEWSIPGMAAAGGGIGLGTGLLGGSFSNRQNIKDLVRLHHERPRLEESRAEFEKMLAQLRKQHPELNKLRRRQVANLLLENKGEIPPEAYYTARRGSEEGLSGLSRNGKIMQLLKKRLMRSGIMGAGIGLGAGAGAGLLAAIGSGKFDQPQS
jgi:hypothetical protein